MVKNNPGTSEPQPLTGKPGIWHRIIPRFTIGVRFISLVVLIALLTGGTVGVAVIKTSQDSLRQEVLTNNLAQADLVAAFASRYMEVIQAHLRVFAERPDIRQPVLNRLNNTLEQLQPTLAQFIQIQTALDNVGIYDANGIQRVISAADATTIGQSFADREWYQQVIVTRQPYLGIPIISRATGKAVVPYAVPIINEYGQLRGVLVGGISLAKLSAAIVNLNLGLSTRISISDSRNGGLIIVHSDPQRILMPVSGKNEATRRVLAGERGVIETTSSTGELDLIGFTPVPALPWGILIVTPKDTALAIVDTLIRNAGLLTAILIVIAAIIGALLMIGVTRPLRRLAMEAKEIGCGNLDRNVTITSRDEIGDLSRAFGDMTEKLKNTMVSRDELVKEVAERKNTEFKLRESQKRFQALVETTNDFIWEMNLKGVYTYCSPQIEKLWGLKPEEMLGKTPFDLLPPEDREQAIKAFSALSESSSSFINMEMRSFDGAGRIRFIEVSGVPFFDIAGKPCGFRGITRDITERKQAEVALQESEENFRRSLDDSPLGIRIVSVEGEIIYANRAILDIYGFDSLEELKTTPRKNSYTPESYAEHQIRIQKRERGEYVPANYEISIVHKNGEIRYLEVLRKEVLWNGKTQFQVICRDITERRKSGDALRESEEFNRLLLEYSPNPILVQNPDTSIQYVNQAFEKLIGYSSSEIIGKKVPYPHWPPEKVNQYLNDIQKHFHQGDSFSGTREFVTKSGEHVWVSLQDQKVFDSTGKFRYCISNYLDITEQKKAEEALRNSEEFSTALRDKSPNPLVVINPDFSIGYVNPAFEKLTGYASVEVVGIRPPFPWWSAEDKARPERIFQVSAEDFYYRRERNMYNKAGEEFWVEISAIPVIINGQFKYHLSNWVDITERKKTEKALGESVNFSTNLLNNAPYPIILFGPDNTIQYVNPAVEKLTLFTSAEIAGKKPPYPYWPEDKIAELQYTLDKDLNSKRNFNVERCFKKKNGELFWVEIISTLLTSTDEERHSNLCSWVDITKRKQGEKQRELSLNILQVLNISGKKKELIHNLLALFKNDGPFEAVGIRLSENDDFPYYQTNGFPVEHIRTENRLCAVDDKGNLLRDSRGNPELECMCGNIICGRFDPAKPFFTKVGSFWTNSTTDLLASTTEVDRQARTRNRCNGEGYESVALIPLKSGDVTIGLIQINDTRRNRFTLELVQYYEGLAQSIGIALSQKQAEEALIKSDKRFKQVTQSAGEMIWEVDADGLYTYCSEAVVKILGYSPGELVGKKHFYDLFAPDCLEKLKKATLSAFQKKQPFEGFINPNVHKNGSIIILETSGVPVLDKDGRLQGYLGADTDITERKQAEERENKLKEELVVSSRLATVGEMAAGISHEINNPLTGVMGFSDLLLKKEIPEDIRKDVEIISEGARRIASIVDRMLRFSRQSKPQETRVNINAIIDTTLVLRAHDMQINNIKVTTNYAPDLPVTWGDAGLLQQVFLNIVLNAEQSMQEAHHKGKLTVKTERIDNVIRVSFKDDGPGITGENMAKLFNPFFTTRDPGKGTGLGLSICYSIITKHGGKIYAQSTFGKGATFFIELPIVNKGEQPTPPEQPVAVVAKSASKARILIVDDEPMVQKFITAVLSGERYALDLVNNGNAALEKIENQEYDVILLDIKLPGLSGIEIYEQLKKSFKPLTRKVIFITSDVMSSNTMAYLQKSAIPYITKPFNTALLVKEIDLILSQ